MSLLQLSPGRALRYSSQGQDGSEQSAGYFYDNCSSMMTNEGTHKGTSRSSWNSGLQLKAKFFRCKNFAIRACS